MYLCYSGHDEIVHEGKNCPCCDKQGEIEVLERTISKLEDQIEELKNELLNR